MGLNYDTLYYVYYEDLTLAGGAVTYHATTDRTAAFASGAAFFLGSIRTPKAGASDTIGFNDGGNGAAQGMRNRFGFVSINTAIPSPGTLTNLANASDDDQSTFATLTAPANGTSYGVVLDFVGLPPNARRNFNRIVANVVYDIPTNTLAGANVGIRAFAQIGFSPPGTAGNVTQNYAKGVTQSKIHFSADLDIPSTLAGNSLIRVSVGVNASDVATQTIVMRVYDAWLDCYE
jgi:hypothetical protein